MAKTHLSEQTPGRAGRPQSASGPVSDAPTQPAAEAPLDQALGEFAPLLQRAMAVNRGNLPGALVERAAALYERLGREQDHGQVVSGVSGAVDAAIRAGSGGFVVAGWFAGARVSQATAVSLCGRRMPLELPLPMRRPRAADSREVPPMQRDARPYAAFVACDDVPVAERWWFAETVFDNGVVARFPFLLPPLPAPRAALEAVLALGAAPYHELPRLLAETIAPAIDRLRAGRPETTLREQVFGTPCRDPTVSVVVPLVGCGDLLRHQIVRVSNDPEWRAGDTQVELIYVLDSAASEEDFERQCRLLYEIYGISFRVAQADAELDPARASNLGAGLAAGGVVLFMTAGVLPKRGRWLSQLLRQYQALERSGVLGCRLLYEDGSIAHAGLGFRRAAEFPEWWTLDRWAKGLPIGFDRHTGAAPVPAVDGACLMVDRALFGELGGLSEDYMFGGFAAADFCLEAERQGAHTYYTPEIELYCIAEDTAWPAAGADQLARETHDMWRFNKKWAEALGRMADENSVAI